MPKQDFPKGFLWGASTAAHQVEGGNHNQWSEWELANAPRLAKNAPKKQAKRHAWSKIAAQAQDERNYISGNGVDHYQRYREDFDLLKSLHMNAFRFSIEWSRIEPEEGKWDETEVEHYRAYIRELKRRGIEPVVTLWHWTMPVWFMDKGGFERRANVHYFERFAAKISTELLEDIRYVVTLNEVNSYTLSGYVGGQWPPQHHNPLLGFWVYRNLLAAHKLAYETIKRIRPNCQVGVAPAIGNILPVRPASRWQRSVTSCLQYIFCWAYIGPLKSQLDFIGVNYYFTYYFDSFLRDRTPQKPLNDLGWYMEPGAIERVLLNTWKRYRKPLLITENGVADGEDHNRKWWLEETMVAMRRALAKGVDLKGYLHWSLLDNFEWSIGWWPKFGLIGVDRTTMKRTLKPSALWLGRYIAKQRL